MSYSIVCRILLFLSFAQCKIFTKVPKSTSQSVGQGRPWQPHDVSIMFKLPLVAVPPNTDDYPPVLKIANAQANQWLLPLVGAKGAITSSLFSKLMKTLNPVPYMGAPDSGYVLSVLRHENLWKIIALRFMPCTNPNAAPNKNPCEAEVRLIAQPVVPSPQLLTIDSGNSRHPMNRGRNLDPSPWANNFLSTEDFAVIFNYRPPAGAPTAAVAQAFQRAAATLTQAGFQGAWVAGVHPAYSQWGPLDHPIALNTNQNKKLQLALQTHHQLIQDVCKENYLKSAEVMFTAGSSHPPPQDARWGFSLYHYKAGDFIMGTIGHGLSFEGQPAPFQVFSTSKDVLNQWAFREDSKYLLPIFLNRKNEAPFQRMFNLSKIKKDVEARAAVIDNIFLTPPLGTDCVSCHYATTLRYVANDTHAYSSFENRFDELLDTLPREEALRKAIAHYKEQLEGNYFGVSQMPQLLKNMAQRDSVPVIPEYNFHQFSYFMHRPHVSQRVLFDTAVAVSLLNGTLPGLAK